MGEGFILVLGLAMIAGGSCSIGHKTGHEEGYEAGCVAGSDGARVAAKIDGKLKCIPREATR